MKNEAPYILEWVAYHRLVGFDHFLIYSNDCEDGTDEILDALAARGWLTHERNQDYQSKSIQWTALKKASKHVLVENAEWILVSDIDEFVNIKTGNGKLDDLFQAVPNTDAIALTWRLFGNSYKINITDKPVIDEFDRAAPFPCHAPWTASQFKTLFRNNGIYQKLGVHRPQKIDMSRINSLRWVNGSGHRLPASFHDQASVTYGSLAGMDLACTNHYSVKSAMSYLTKTTRGLPNRSQKEIDLGYWVDRNFNTVEEKSIQRHLPTLHEKLAELQTDGTLRNLAKQGLEWHKKRAEDVMDHLEGLQLLTRILGTERRDINPSLAKNLLAKRLELRQRMQNQ